MPGHVISVKTYLVVFFALLGLTALTTYVAFVDLGEELNTIVALTIAVSKMLLVILFFMHVKYSPGLTKVVIIAGFFFLAILVSLTMADVMTRGWSPEPTGWGAILPTTLPYLRGVL
jgi:cytochrome c oxidase subunit IV